MPGDGNRDAASTDSGRGSLVSFLPMPRAARIAPGGQVYHVLNRSVGRMHLFGKNADFEAFQRVMIEAHQRHPIRILSYLCFVELLALCCLAGGRRPGHGLLPLAGAHACDALEGRASDRGLRTSISGAIQELPGAGRRTSVDRFARRRAECRGCRARCASGGLALERPVGEESWGRCDQGHALALAAGTPGGLDRSSECAAEREGTGAAASERREGPTFR